MLPWCYISKTKKLFGYLLQACCVYTPFIMQTKVLLFVFWSFYFLFFYIFFTLSLKNCPWALSGAFSCISFGNFSLVVEGRIHILCLNKWFNFRFHSTILLYFWGWPVITSVCVPICMYIYTICVYVHIYVTGYHIYSFVVTF